MGGRQGMTFFETTEAEVLPRRTPRARAAARLRAPAWRRATFRWTLVAVLVIAVCAFALWPMTGQVVPWDSKNQFYPFFRFLADGLRRGDWPLWNPYEFAGSPSAADPQSLLFTPSMLLFALVAPNASMTVFDAVVYGHLVLGGFGMVGLARRWRWHPSAAILAASVFMLGGAAASRLEHTGMIISYSWFPTTLWALQAALDRRSLRLALAAGVLATLMALGRDQVAFLLCMALAGAVLRQALRGDAPLAYLRSRAPVLLVCGLVVVVLMAVPVLLTLQFLHGSNRPAIAYGTALAASLDPVNLMTLVAPDFFGSLGPQRGYWGPGAGTVLGNDWTDPPVDYLFIGTVPFLLIVWHGLAGGRLLERGARYFALVMVAALIYAIGRHTALFGFIFDWVPGVSLYRRPADASFVVNIAFAFSAGYLLHRFVEEGLPRLDLMKPPHALLPIGATLGIAWLFGAALAFAWHAGHLNQSLRILAEGAIFLGLAASVILLMRGQRYRQLAGLLLAGGTAIQLIAFNAASSLNAESPDLYRTNATLPPDQARGLAILRQDMAAHRQAGADPRVEVQGIDGAWQNAAMIFKLRNLAGYNPLRIDAYERAVGVGESTNDPRLRHFPDTFRGYNSRLANLLGLQYLILGTEIAQLPRDYPRPRASLIWSSPDLYIYRLDNAPVPRVHLATSLRAVDSDDVIDSGVIPDFNMVDSALLEEDDVPRLTNKSLLEPATGSGGTAVLREERNDRLTVDVDASRPAFLVCHEIFYPGWVARLDGQEVPILRTDLLFRGVEVPAGHHTVQFRYEPFAARNLWAALRGLMGDDE